MNTCNYSLPKDMAEILASRFINNVVEDDEVDMRDIPDDFAVINFNELPW